MILCQHSHCFGFFKLRNSCQAGTLPHDWKLAHTTPVFKKGERYKAENYRPISLTCIACKVMEHIIANNIISHIEKNNILCQKQNGFRCGRSCEMQLLGYVNETSEELERGNQEDTIVIDFEKAFDKVSHTLPVHKLRRYGIGGRLNAWIDSFLENRQQAVVVGGERPNFMPVDSVGGPCLFLLYINDLLIDIESKIHMFADVTLCSNIIKHKEDQKKLQKDLDSITIWEKHPQKC